MGHTREHRYRVDIAWTGDRGSGTSGYEAYGRDHEVRIDGKPVIAASSDPQFRGDATRHNPEELFVAALSSCHMLWYLHLCADAGIVVTRYEDAAEGTMVIAAHGGGQFREVVLRPRVAITSGDAAQARALHERAHALCFIANSVSCAVRIEAEIAT
ncbi:MAG: OsmC family protein [Planctomycetota bacterium]